MELTKEEKIKLIVDRISKQIEIPVGKESVNYDNGNGYTQTKYDYKDVVDPEKLAEILLDLIK